MIDTITLQDIRHFIECHHITYLINGNIYIYIYVCVCMYVYM